MPPVTKIDCETKNHLSLSEKLVILQLLQLICCLIFGISFVCHQKPHSLQPNQIYGNLVTNIPKSYISNDAYALLGIRIVCAMTDVFRL
jgi:hypothetical protein